MNLFYRILICAAILLSHAVIFFLPVAELFLVYIILFNPRWFRDFLDRLGKPRLRASE